MDDTEFAVRLVRDDEEALIFSFLTIAARMEADEPIQKAIADPALAKYWKGWGRESDLGAVIELSGGGLPVACAWVRLLGPENPGFGYVAPDIPELGVGVLSGYRGLGLGTLALRRLLDECRGQFPGVSLSVREDNPAIRLYTRLGFEALSTSAEPDPAETRSLAMLLRFERAAP